MTTEMQQAPKMILEYCNICCDSSSEKVKMFSLNEVDYHDEDFLYKCSTCSEKFWISINEAIKNEVK